MTDHSAPSAERQDTRTASVRRLNDDFRRTGVGGRVMMTSGIAALPRAEQLAIVAAVAAFDGFTYENDPYGEHDCALLNVSGRQILWKIDYFDHALRCHSPDAADPDQTTRVMTIMLAEEY